jgi:hypothetical protein
MLNIKFGARAASRYGSGSTKMIRPLAVLGPQHSFFCRLNWKKLVLPMSETGTGLGLF